MTTREALTTTRLVRKVEPATQPQGPDMQYRFVVHTATSRLIDYDIGQIVFYYSMPSTLWARTHIGPGMAIHATHAPLHLHPALVTGDLNRAVWAAPTRSS